MRASVIANRDYKVATIDNRLYGAFLEHLGRAIYSGIYEPDHKTADEDGMRKRRHRPRARTEGAAGPLSRRQFRLRLQLGRRHRPAGEAADAPRLAWQTSETNEVGIHEFAAGAKPPAPR